MYFVKKNRRDAAGCKQTGEVQQGARGYKICSRVLSDNRGAEGCERTGEVQQGAKGQERCSGCRRTKEVHAVAGCKRTGEVQQSPRGQGRSRTVVQGDHSAPVFLLSSLAGVPLCTNRFLEPWE